MVSRTHSSHCLAQQESLVERNKIWREREREREIDIKTEWSWDAHISSFVVFFSPSAGSAHSLYCSGVQYGASPKNREREKKYKFLRLNQNTDLDLEKYTAALQL